jgi:hypothetical protein
MCDKIYILRVSYILIYMYIINLNNHASNDCESPSGSDTIATRVRAKYSKARQKKIHRKSQHFTAWNRDNTSSSESLSYEY